MKLSYLVAGATLAVSLAALGPAASATELMFTYKVPNLGVETFDLNTADGIVDTPDSVIFVTTNDSKGNYNAYFSEYTTGPNGTYGYFGTGGPNGFYDFAGSQSFYTGQVGANGKPTIDAAVGDSFTASNGTVVSVTAVPEPSAWALVLVGVGLTGAGLRYGRRRVMAALTA